MPRLLAFSLMLLLALPACSDAPSPASPAPSESTDAPTSEATEREEDALTVVYLGDSLTAGYGLARGAEEAYPALLEARADSAGLPIQTVNAGVSGDTSAGGLRRVEWLTSRYDIDVLVLALGANDGLRGLSVEALRENLEGIIRHVRAANPGVRIVLAGMLVPTNMGGDYGRRFSEVFPALAEAEDVTLVPFLLDGVGGVRALNQPDGVHPTAEGQRVMAETVWRALRPVLEAAHAERS